MTSTRQLPISRRAALHRSSRWLVSAGVLVTAVASASEALASTCYQQPFGNPDLADGWHSTCCGRTNPHQGVDYPQGAGTPIPSVADGTVAKSGVSGCLGNYVIVAHADGMFSGYSHMSSGTPLAVGTGVARGQTIGYVGNTGTCSQGAHLHLTMAPTVDGFANGNNVDPYAYIEAHKQCNAPPTGYIDQADCDVVRGWAFDPDAGAGPIGTHLYFDAPAPSGHGVALVASQKRDDLCAAVGSCNHGYSWPTPYSLFNGQGHPVHAYGIDAPGGNNPQLGSSPRTITCSPPTPKGVKRHIANPTVLAAWRFDGFQDLPPIDAKIIDALPEGAAIPSTPVTVKGKGDTVWLVDGKRKRPIPSPAVIEAWRLPWGEVQTKPDAEIEALETGPVLRARPMMVKDSQGRLLIMDDVPAIAAGGSGGGAGAAGKGAGGGAGKAASGGSTTSGTGGASPTTGGSAGASQVGVAGSSAAGHGQGATAGSGGRAGNAGAVTSGDGGNGGNGGKPSRGDAGPSYEAIDEEASGSCALAGPSRAAPGWAAILALGVAGLRKLRRRDR